MSGHRDIDRVESARNRHNVLVRHYGPDHPKVRAAAKELRALKHEEHIRRIVADWPKLTEAQRARIAQLMPLGRRRPEDGEAA